MRPPYKFEIHKAKNSQPYFTFVTGSGRVLVVSECYATLKELNESLAILKNYALDSSLVDKRNTKHKDDCHPINQVPLHRVHH